VTENRKVVLAGDRFRAVSLPVYRETEANQARFVCAKHERRTKPIIVCHCGVLGNQNVASRHSISSTETTARGPPQCAQHGQNFKLAARCGVHGPCSQTARFSNDLEAEQTDTPRRRFRKWVQRSQIMFFGTAVVEGVSGVFLRPRWLSAREVFRTAVVD
jgi:hypothetical protein